MPDLESLRRPCPVRILETDNLKVYGNRLDGCAGLWQEFLLCSDWDGPIFQPSASCNVNQCAGTNENDEACDGDENYDKGFHYGGFHSRCGCR